MFGPKIIEIDPTNPSEAILKYAAGVLKNGGVVVYPTDTAYAIGVNAYNARSIKNVYDIKNRDHTKPTHVVVRDWTMVEGLCLSDRIAKTIGDKFFPGPLTLILNKHDLFPPLLTGGKTTLGIRIPKYEFTIRLSQIVDFPYTTPSANKDKKKTPYSIQEVKAELGFDGIDLVINAGQLKETSPSTIIDLSQGLIEIVREGPIKSTEIINYLKSTKVWQPPSG